MNDITYWRIKLLYLKTGLKLIFSTFEESLSETICIIYISLKFKSSPILVIESKQFDN